MTTTRYVDWDGLLYYDSKIKQYINDIEQSKLTFGGVVQFDILPPPTAQNLNTIYTIENEFTVETDNVWFHETYRSKKYSSRCVIINAETSEGIYEYIVLVDAGKSDAYTKEESDKKLETLSRTIGEDLITLSEKIDTLNNTVNGIEVYIKSDIRIELVDELPDLEDAQESRIYIVDSTNAMYIWKKHRKQYYPLNASGGSVSFSEITGGNALSF